MITLIAFDADDTLWHNENLFSQTQEKFKQLLSTYHSPEWVEKKLYETEMRNLRHFGYGIKGFTLSMIETAIELSQGQIAAADILEIINFAKEMLKAPVKLLDHVAETVARLAESYDLMIITKGDLYNQEEKISRSGLGHYFKHIEIVSKKEEETYRKILRRCGIDPANFLMVGNSMKSDIIPAITIGAKAAYLPYHLTWQYESPQVDEKKLPGFFKIDHIGQLPELLNAL